MLNIFKKIKLTHILTAIFVGYLGMTSFVSAQFKDSINLNCTTSSCENLSSYAGYNCKFIIKDNRSYGVPYVENCGSSHENGRFSSSKNFPDNYNCSFSFSYSDRGDAVIECSKDLLPVSEFAPVITGLNNSINEFIPYVVYVGLGVLGALIGFFAIKRLIRYVRGGTLSIFSSRKRK